ncbi:DUF6436 domain-containing protein [Teredinibacter haidensis]|uniref:DUF6436 domain-containing protein n=1 Tax=Teredinibacter haidensis TaxID=2731755 RepID=UPI000A9E2EB3|nr:DUF6436 domain-containing protein [Teredinibacter haidensis]
MAKCLTKKAVNGKMFFAALLVATWALLTLLTFWWYDIRLLRPFAETTVFFEAKSIAVPQEFLGKASVKVVHFYEPGCYCNGPNLEHLEKLIQLYGEKNIEFFVLHKEKPKVHSSVADSLLVVDAATNHELYQLVPSSPGVAIWDANNKLTYFGPYSLGPTCNSPDGFVEGVLDDLILGRSPVVTSTIGSGCFCNWKENSA